MEKSHANIMAKRALVDATLAIAHAVGTQRASTEIAALLQVGDAKCDKAGTLNEGTTSAWMKLKESVRALTSTEMAKVSGDVLQHFKDLAKEVARKSVDTHDCLDTEREAVVRSLKDQEHKANQVSAWSSTPQFDRASVSCAVSVIGSICLHSKSILRLHAEPDVDVAVDGNLKNVLDQRGDLDTTKPKLVWALGEELAAEFITHAMLVRSVAIPQHEKMVLASVSRAKDLMQNLSDVLVEEPEPIKMTAFYPQLSKQTASKMKELRAKLKEEQALELEPALKSKADEILLRSRQQLLKWVEAQTADSVQKAKGHYHQAR